MSPDNLSKEDRIKTMRSVKSTKTSPERKVHAILARLGISGWRTNQIEITGKPDIVFPNLRAAIFIDGCFWHGCPICNCILPSTHQEYWNKKISRNMKRDKENTIRLEQSGWRVLRIWEHEVMKGRERDLLRKKIEGFLKN